MEADVLKKAVEAILFVAGEPLSIKRLVEMFAPEVSDIQMSEVINKLVQEWNSRDSGIELVEVGGGYRFRTKPDLGELIRLAFLPKPRQLTPAALETLAIIAYKQPIVRSDIEKLRGVDCGGVLKTLLDKGLIKIVGKKDEPGQPLLYATTPQFLEFFGLKSISDLPPLKDVDQIRQTLAGHGEDYGLDDFVVSDDNRLDLSRPEDDAALLELEQKMRELSKLERDVFSREEVDGGYPSEGQNNEQDKNNEVSFSADTPVEEEG